MPSASRVSALDASRSAQRSVMRTPGIKLTAATPNLDRPIPQAAARQQLTSVQQKVSALRSAGKPAVVIFDIDDTLTKWKKNDTVAGARDYVKSLKASGATIVYVTGRREGMRAETMDHLKQHGFPLGKDERLVLNNTRLRVGPFKAIAARQVAKELGTPVAAFDNEKGNARVLRRSLPPKTAVFRLATTSQRGDPGGIGHVSVIRDFTSVAEK